jgi:pyrroline-5-carboxylate reductase
MKKNIGIIGGGNLGKSLANGLVNFGNFKAVAISIYRRSEKHLAELKSQGFDTTSSNIELTRNNDIIIIAVLPQQIDNVLEEIAPYLEPTKLVVSLVTSVELHEIKAKLNGHENVVRAMPNTAISLGQSMTCICADKEQTEGLKIVKMLFDSLGKAIVINENQMTSATALCACGTAFFLRAIRAAMQGGTEIDFHAEEALLMAAQTAKGAAMLLLENGSHPEEEIDKVTSPKGCTIAGLNNMEHSGFSSAFIKGITTSADKAKGLY